MSEMPGPDPEVFLARHSQAAYKSFSETIGSENPQSPYDPESQITPDLTEAGAKLAHEKAEQFLDLLHPETDLLFFVSSNEARALETANIYRQIAHSRGFEVISPDNPRSKLAATLGEGEIRVIDNLSINSKNPLIDSLFNPVRMPSNTNWGAVDRETKDKWDAARAIVSSDDRGSWGSNFHAHSHEVKEIFPEIKTAEELYEGKFQNLMRLVKWADKKVRGSGLEKNVKILAFGHENYLVVALDRYFHEHNINNCETIRLKVEDRIVKGEFHDKEAEIG